MSLPCLLPAWVALRRLWQPGEQDWLPRLGRAPGAAVLQGALSAAVRRVTVLCTGPAAER